MESLTSFLASLNINKDETFHFVDKLKCIHINKYEHFLLEGEAGKYMGYVDQGHFRYYKTDKEGNEKTLWFNKTFPFIGDYHSFLKKSNAELSVQAMDTYDVVLFSYEQMMELFNTNEDTQRLRTMVAERSMFGWRDIAMTLHFDTAEERYMKLLNDYPDIEKEIPLKYIASCIGISPETLSRIRNKTEKKQPD